MPSDNSSPPYTGETFATDYIADGGVANLAKVERVKAGFGADGSYSDVAPDNGLPAVGGYKELTGSATANATDLVASTDVRVFRWLSLQLSGTFSASVRVQGSNDGTTWTDMPVFLATGWTTGNPVIGWRTNLTAVGIYCGPVLTRYIRVRTAAYTSGTATATLELSAAPGINPPNLLTDASGIVSTTLSLTAPLTSSDGFGAGADMRTASLDMVYNGTSWDRRYSATAAAGTSGTGLAGAGVLGWDATNSVFRRLLCDASGYLLTRPQAVATATLTNVPAAVTTGNLVASNTSRRGLTVYNDTTGTNSLYLKLGATASTTSFTVKIGPGGYWELPTFAAAVYTGAVDGIWDSASGSARITEL